MSRTRVRARQVAIVMAAIAMVTAGCEQYDGRKRVRLGNRLFRETAFIDAVSEYEKALTEVDDPIIDYNAGLAYSKIFKPGLDKPVRLGLAGSVTCQVIPNVKSLEAQVCLKEGDRRFDDCDDAKNVCASSFTCQKTTLCALDSPALAELAAAHLQKWLAANPSDDETRKLMTQVWIDSEQFGKALEYWEARLKDKPNDLDIMGNLAGINLKANKWRESIQWYSKVAGAATDLGAKIGAYQFIGNVAWAKLNSKTLTGDESLELADQGIGALQAAAALAPKNPKLFGLQAAILNFRAAVQGASWAGAIDRATAQDLLKLAHVLREQAKAQGEGATPPSTPSPSRGPAEKVGG